LLYYYSFLISRSNKCQKLSDDVVALCGDQSLLGVPGESRLMSDLVKDELIMEDYGEVSDGGLVETCYEESESSELATEGGDENPSTAQDGPAPFESVVCDTIIKEEPVAVEDESENFEMTDSATTSSHTTEPSPSGVGEGSLGSLARFANTLGAPTQDVPSQLVQVAIPNSMTDYSSCSATTTTNYSATNLIGIRGTDIPAGSNNAPVFSVTNTPPISVANTRISSTNPPGQPSQGRAFPCRCDDSGVFISLKNVPIKRRKKTKEKLIRLVKLIAELDLDPDEVSFTVTTK